MTDERLGIRSEYTREPVDYKQEAAEWLQRRILEAVKETERRFGVYIAGKPGIRHAADDEFWSVYLNANLWPEAMRITAEETV